MTVRFNADPRAAFAGCVIQDAVHADAPGIWPSGNVASDVCARHMENFKAALKRQAQRLLTPSNKLWFLGKKGPTKENPRP